VEEAKSHELVNNQANYAKLQLETAFIDRIDALHNPAAAASVDTWEHQPPGGRMAGVYILSSARGIRESPNEIFDKRRNNYSDLGIYCSFHKGMYYPPIRLSLEVSKNRPAALQHPSSVQQRSA